MYLRQATKSCFLQAKCYEVRVDADGIGVDAGGIVWIFCSVCFSCLLCSFHPNSVVLL